MSTFLITATICSCAVPYAFRRGIALCSYKQTIGVDFFLKQLTLPGDKHVAVQVKLADCIYHFLGSYSRCCTAFCVLQVELVNCIHVSCLASSVPFPNLKTTAVMGHWRADHS